MGLANKSSERASDPRTFFSTSRLHPPPRPEHVAKPLRAFREDFRIPKTPQKTKAPRTLNEGGATGSHSFSRRGCGGTIVVIRRCVPGRPGRSPDSRHAHGPATPSHPFSFCGQWLRPGILTPGESAGPAAYSGGTVAEFHGLPFCSSHLARTWVRSNRNVVQNQIPLQKNPDCAT